MTARGAPGGAPGPGPGTLGLPELPAHAAPDTAGLPVFWEYAAPAAWRSIDLLSDVHLAADHPRTFEAFAAHLRHTPADAVFILGDLFELWAGDDLRHAPFEAACVDLLAETAARRGLAFMAGNRDFLIGADMLDACGMTALADPTVLVAWDRRWLLSHGDALCIDDHAYQRFRAQVRDPHWQRRFLAQPPEQRQQQARAVRSESARLQGAMAADPDAWVDADTATAVRWLHEAGAPTLVHGHTHMPGSEPLAPGFVRHVLSDWEHDDPARAPRGDVLRLSAEGARRVAPSTGPAA